MVIDSIAGMLIGAVGSLIVGTTMYSFRRMGSHRDQTAGHEARLAAIEATLTGVEHTLDRILRRLENTEKG